MTTALNAGGNVKPYYQDDAVTLHHGKWEDVLPAIGMPQVDLIVTDPPYGETSLDWDGWQKGWAACMAELSSSMWCFGSMRMFLERRDEFSRWKLSQDVVWEKHNGSGFASDRFRRVHEHALHWYRGEWSGIHHDPPRLPHDGPDKSRRGQRQAAHLNGSQPIDYTDDGLRISRSVIKASRPNQGRNVTEKPLPVLEQLIAYGCPVGGMVLDIFAGSCSTGIAARNIGRRAICIEARESQCEAAAEWLSAGILDFAGAS